jgi:hypothetical protein
MTAPYTVGELAAARAILAALPRDLPPDVIATVMDAVDAIERAQDLLTVEIPTTVEPDLTEQDDFERAARSGR